MTDTDLVERLRGLTDAHRTFFANWSTCDDGCGFSFKHMERKTGMGRAQFKPLVYDLVEAGCLQFMRGCMTDEGKPYGSAYVLTAGGWSALRALSQEPSK